MKHSELLNQFREELASLSQEVETSVAMGHFDLNKICEDVVCAIFRELYGFENLRNLNEDNGQNYPGIDLADDEAGVAIQVTSDKTLEKVKDSLKTITKHGLHDKYSRIIFYILTRKQGSYSATAVNDICEGKLAFDVSSDILDFTNLATRAATAEPHRVKRVVDVLRAYMQGCEVGLADEDFDHPQEPPETLSANLVSVYFPNTLFIADLKLRCDTFGSLKQVEQLAGSGQHLHDVFRQGVVLRQDH